MGEYELLEFTNEQRRFIYAEAYSVFFFLFPQPSLGYRNCFIFKFHIGVEYQFMTVSISPSFYDRLLANSSSNL